MSDPGNLNHGHTGDEDVLLTIRLVPVCVKREAPDEASQQVRGLGGPAQAPAQDYVKQEPVKREPVQAPAAVEQPDVHLPVHNEQAPAAAVQAPAPGGPVRPRSTREKKQPESLKGYGRFGLFQGRRRFMPY